MSQDFNEALLTLSILSITLQLAVLQETKNIQLTSHLYLLPSTQMELATYRSYRYSVGVAVTHWQVM